MGSEMCIRDSFFCRGDRNLLGFSVGIEIDFLVRGVEIDFAVFEPLIVWFSCIDPN